MPTYGTGMNTVELLQTLRTLLLPIVQNIDPDANIFVGRIPPTALPPGTNRPVLSLRLFDRRFPGAGRGLDGGAERLSKLEIMVYWRGENNAEALETFCDALESHLATVSGNIGTSGGLMYGVRGGGRDTIAAPSSTIALDVLTVRMMFTLTEHPAGLITPS